MKINGSLIALKEPQTLYEYLMAQGYDLAFVAVERNGEIVPKAAYRDVLLKDEDTMEIVRFVGGG
nr:sulfur carrier protein ThiS [uncultured Bacillus sp.]